MLTKQRRMTTWREGAATPTKDKDAPARLVRKIAKILLVALAASIGGASAAAGGPEVRLFRTSSGAELALPTIGGLDCRGLEAVLLEIGDSGYRPIGPDRPDDPLDRALFEYENAAAARQLEECQRNGRARNFSLPLRDRSLLWRP